MPYPTPAPLVFLSAPHGLHDILACMLARAQMGILVFTRRHREVSVWRSRG